MSGTKLRNIIKFETENFDIDYLRNHYLDILEKYRDKIKASKHEKKYVKAENKRIKKEINKQDDYDDYDDYYDYYSAAREARFMAKLKNMDLVDSYERFKTEMCGGIGQRKIKLFLNRKIKAGDEIANLYRVALEIENTNINAKKYKNTMYVDYKDNLYAQKEELLKQLLNLCAKYNNTHDDKIEYGYQHSDNYSANKVIYFDLPDTEQISFHSNISKKNMGESTPVYNKQWDNKVNSTLYKIESAINERYKEEIVNLKK